MSFVNVLHVRLLADVHSNTFGSWHKFNSRALNLSVLATHCLLSTHK